MNGEQYEIPDILFIVLHESGNVVYTYPEIGDHSYVLSSLTSAIFSLGEELSGEIMKVASTNIGKRRLFFMKDNEVIYSLFVAEKYDGDFEGLLLALVSLVNSNFPAEIIDGLVKMKGETETLSKRINSTIEAYIDRPHFGEISDRKQISMLLTYACDIFDREKTVQLFRGLLANKKIVVIGYGTELISKVLRFLGSFWPEKLRLVPASEINLFERDTGKVIFVAGRGKKEELKNKLENSIFIDFDNPPDNTLENDMLLEKVNEILDIERKETRRLMLEKELVTLNSIAKDIRKITSNSSEKIPIKKLREQLTKKHPQDKAEYVLNVLMNLETPVKEKIEAPKKWWHKII